MKIWDMHCHLPSPNLTGESLLEQAENMLEIASRLKISKLCLFLETGKPRGPFSDDEIMRVLERYYDRLYGFVWCDLKKQDQCLDLLQKWVGDGPMVGLKLGGYSGICSRPEHAPIFEKAIDLKAVIYQHAWLKVGGNLSQESTPHDVVKLAQRYPDYPFICGHAGGDWELGIRAVTAAPNVSIGIGGFYPTSGVVEMGVRLLGPQRVLYGSDAPGRSFSSQLGKVLGADLPDAHKQMILHDNLARLMRPIFTAKGWNLD
ncbi:MAG: amidohydrolase family protein [Blastopirellula sp. JB062]